MADGGWPMADGRCRIRKEGRTDEGGLADARIGTLARLGVADSGKTAYSGPMLHFYYGSGSPFAWKVWLALEHKGLAYELHTLSFSGGDLKTPAYLAINPRGRVPSIVHDDFALYESTAIVEYLDDTFPEPPLLPVDRQARALVRRLAFEGDNTYYPTARKLFSETLFRPRGDGDPALIERATEGLLREGDAIEQALDMAVPESERSYADYALYPHFALLRRLAERMPAHRRPFESLGPRIRSLMARVESKPFFAKTFPPHWKD